MGGIFFSKQSNSKSECLQSLTPIEQTRKRPPSPYESPTCKRIRTTYDHIYSQLFLQGEGSDFTVETPTKLWKLHKIYIKQSPFFSAMFSGSWKDSTADYVKLEFPDSLITEESLHLVFGSFYWDRLECDENNVLNVLATATWFQLEDIRSHCEDIMCQMIKLSNVVDLHEAADQYALVQLQGKCTEWLGRCFMSLEEGPSFLHLMKKLSKTFMTRLLQCPRFYVVHIEQDLLSLLHKWVFLQCNPDYLFSSSSELSAVTSQFILNKVIPNFNGEFSIYQSLFACIRWEHIITVEKTAITSEKIVPTDWILMAYRTQWLRLLSCNELSQPGPPNDLNEELFWSHSERCGKKLSDSPCSWRWCGFNYGVDLVFRYKNRSIYVSRYFDSQASEGFSSLASLTRVQLYLSATSLTSSGDVLSHCSTSKVLKLNLYNNVSHKILSLPSDVVFPVVISANILRYDPTLKPLSSSISCSTHMENLDQHCCTRICPVDTDNESDDPL